MEVVELNVDLGPVNNLRGRSMFAEGLSCIKILLDKMGTTEK